MSAARNPSEQPRVRRKTAAALGTAGQERGTDIEQVAFVRCVSADATLALASEEWKDHPPKGARGARFSLREGRPESASTRSARGQLTMYSHRVMLNRQASSVRHDRAAL